MAHEHDDIPLSLGERLAVWQAEMAESERTIVCPAEHEARVRADLGWTGWKIVVSPFCPPDTLLMIDEHALQAAQNEALQHLRLTMDVLSPTEPGSRQVLQEVLDALRK